MTDNDIMKALECCTVDTTNNCKKLKCPMYKHCKKDLDALDKLALDLINRQKATIKEFDEKIVMQMGLIEHQRDEIEENNLKIDHQAQIIRTLETALGNKMAEIERLKAEIANTDNILASLDRPILEVKTEAIKDFAERLKEKRFDGIYPYVLINDIDNLVEEMTEEQEREN